MQTTLAIGIIVWVVFALLLNSVEEKDGSYPPYAPAVFGMPMFLGFLTAVVGAAGCVVNWINS